MNAGALAGIGSWIEAIGDEGRGTGLKMTECEGEAGSNVDGTPPIFLDSWMAILMKCCPRWIFV
jgi:hypothetical protein